MQAYECLELEWANFNQLDPKGMVACSSGTAALHLSLEAMRLPQGSEVVTNNFSMIAVPRAIVMAGLTPVFIDCNERLLMDIGLVEDYLSVVPDGIQQGALIAVHIYGRQVDMDRLFLKKQRQAPSWYVIEDLAEAHGVRPHKSTDAACFSFYANKIISGAEGGAVWFKDPEHAKLARCLRSLGFTADHDFMHVPRGHNYRMSNVHAELILKSLDWANGFCGDRNGPQSSLPIRREIEGWYDKYCPDEWKMPSRDAVWVYDLKLPTWDAKVMNAVVKKLNGEGITARHGFKPMSRQPEFERCKVIRNECKDDPGWGKADVMAARVMYLPVLPGKTKESDCKKEFDIIRGIVGG